MDHAGEVYHDCASYRGSDGGRGDVPVSFVVRFTDSGPNTVHERVVVGLAVMETAVGFTKRVRLFSSGNEVAFGRQTGDNGANFTATGEVAHWFSVPGFQRLQCYIHSWPAVNIQSSSGDASGSMTTSGTLASMASPSLH